MEASAECKLSGVPSCEYYPDWKKREVSTGTTLVACQFDGGVVIGADSRTSSGTYVVNRVTDKLTPLTKYIYCCRSGSAADTQAIADIVRYHLDFHAIEMGREPTVFEAATIYSIPVGGMLIKQPAVIGGSGSTYLYGHFDSELKPNMTKQEALEFVSKCVGLAINRDGSSGGCIRLGIISSEGVERRLIKGSEVPLFSYKE
ncbi:unnamed protein product [Dibothriocephalus latus]|uniref:Proteasome endopeptidase complex n=1 Tax=Dibothriocephalus latus TaxID=60516 RepID=A0A3P7KZP6_DIBLA|nr:unnamed protein product [Dibothriocephalus latus]